MGNQQPSKEEYKMVKDPYQKTKEQFSEELKRRFPKDNVEILKFDKASGPIEYKCLNCGRIYKKSRANHLYENKTLCQKCNSARPSICREGFLKALKDNFEVLDENYETKAISTKFHIRCKKCGEDFYHRIQMADLNGDFRCPRCETGPVSIERLKKRFEEVGLDKEFEIISYEGITKPLIVRHKCGYIFSRLPWNLLGRSRGCPKCNPRRSAGEDKIYNFLKRNNIIFEEQKKFPQLGTLSYDFFLPEQKVLIEYQGIQHYEPVEYFGGEEKFIQQVDRDNRKKKFAEEEGYYLLEIPSSKFNDIEKILAGLTTISAESKTE